MLALMSQAFTSEAPHRPSSDTTNFDAQPRRVASEASTKPADHSTASSAIARTERPAIRTSVNDANRGVTAATFKSQLEELIGKLQKGGARVVLCSLTSLGEKHDGSNNIDKRLDELAEVARTVAREQKIPLNDLRRAFVAYWKEHNKDNQPSGLLTYDGNHFNQKGMDFVAEQMLRKLR